MKKAYYIVGEDKEGNLLSEAFFAETHDTAEKDALSGEYSTIFKVEDVTSDIRWDVIETREENITHLERYAQVGNYWYPESMAL